MTQVDLQELLEAHDVCEHAEMPLFQIGYVFLFLRAGEREDDSPPLSLSISFQRPDARPGALDTATIILRAQLCLCSLWLYRDPGI